VQGNIAAFVAHWRNDVATLTDVVLQVYSAVSGTARQPQLVVPSFTACGRAQPVISFARVEIGGHVQASKLVTSSQSGHHSVV
jgi:hypothetical protein